MFETNLVAGESASDSGFLEALDLPEARENEVLKRVECSLLGSNVQ